MRLDEWIVQDWNRWYAICGVKEQALTDQEAMNVLDDVMWRYQTDKTFLGIIYLILTRYGKDPDEESL